MGQETEIDIADVEEPLRSALLECEVTGNRTLIRRGDRPIAVLTSWDEYLALSDTAALMAEEDRIGRIREAERELETGRVLADERLAGTMVAIARSSGWEELSPNDGRAAVAIAKSLLEDPIAGAPLFPPFRGLWSVRRDDLRLVYRVAREARGIGIVLAERPKEEA